MDTVSIEGKKRKMQEQEKSIKENMSRIRHKIIIISGKGGVGKTTVSVALAISLSRRKLRAGLLDIDIHGPNTAKMLGVEGARMGTSGKGIQPVKVAENLTAVSMTFLLDNPDTAIIWRGPLKMIAIQQFLGDVAWGELDWLVIDSPPGTGDEPLSICQLIPEMDGIIIVTTPQDVALLDARKAVSFAKEIKVPIVGIIENMSGFTCPYCGKPIDLFKKGGGEKAAGELSVPFLGAICLDTELVEASDSGRLLSLSKKGKAAQAIEEIADKIIVRLGGEPAAFDEEGNEAQRSNCEASKNK
ncbi:MAG: ATP-binding protein [Candidatus Omnitrophica bacterium 4484_213]|nr:MAG: ATP-binding protein [Candidatus Omnitrophica bacterium 4484_213]